MIDLDDHIYIDFKSGKKISYRAYCSSCGKDRGYISKSNYNKSSKCKSCSRVVKPKEENVHDSFIIKYKKAYFLTDCVVCGNSKGYISKRDVSKPCLSCSKKDIKHSLETKIKISCNKSGISVSEFSDFKQPENIKERKQFNKQKMHEKCFQKANYTCEVCGNRGGNLNAHHINSWSCHPEKRFNLSNLACLCEKCHISFHIKFGYDVSLKEFNEFKSSS